LNVCFYKTNLINLQIAESIVKSIVSAIFKKQCNNITTLFFLILYCIFALRFNRFFHFFAVKKSAKVIIVFVLPGLFLGF